MWNFAHFLKEVFLEIKYTIWRKENDWLEHTANDQFFIFFFLAQNHWKFNACCINEWYFSMTLNCIYGPSDANFSSQINSI